MELELVGKSALVTGASKGIGRATAAGLAAEGCALHLAARTAANLAEVRDDLAARFGTQATIHPGDLGRSDEVTALAAANTPARRTESGGTGKVCDFETNETLVTGFRRIGGKSVRKINRL